MSCPFPPEKSSIMDNFPNFSSNLSSFLQSINIKSVKQSQTITELWNEIVGESVANVTLSVYYSEGVIWVELSSTAWVNEMMYLREDIVSKYNEKLQKNIIKEVLFKVKSKYQEKKEHFTRLNKKTPKVPPRPVIKELKSNEHEDIEQQISQVDDERLKSGLKRFFEVARKKELALLEMGWKKCVNCHCLHNDKNSLCLPCRAQEPDKSRG